MHFIIRPDNDCMARVMHTLSELPADKSWDVTIKPHVKRKTDQQRKYLHKLYSLIKDVSGYTIEEQKTAACFHLGLTRDVMLRTGEVIKERLSTEDLSRDDYGKLINDAQDNCVFLEINYPQPAYYGYQF